MAKIFIDMLLPDNVVVESAEQLEKDLLEEFSVVGLKQISVTRILHGYKLVINELEWNSAFQYWMHHKINDEMKLDIFRSKLIIFFTESLPTARNVNSIRLYYTYPPMNMITVMTIETKYGDIKLTISTVSKYRGEDREYETALYGYDKHDVNIYVYSRVKSITEAELQHHALIASVKTGHFKFVPKTWEAVEVVKEEAQ